MKTQLRYLFALFATIVFGFAQVSLAKEINCREDAPPPWTKYRISLQIGTNHIAKIYGAGAHGLTLLDTIKCGWMAPSVFYRHLQDTVIGNCEHKRGTGNGFEVTFFLKKGEGTLLAEVARKDRAGNPDYFWKMTCDEI